MSLDLDPFTTAIIQDALVSVGEEMFTAMVRTSMSAIIYEATDFAVGITDADGELLAQGNGVAGFLATLDASVQSLLRHYGGHSAIRPGDVFIGNIPYEGGGTHLSDVTLIMPVFSEGRLIAFTANKAHWTEVGGAQPGSVSTEATEIYQEGLQFRWLRLYDQGQPNEPLMAMIHDNVRLPKSTLGDMHAGVASLRVGGKRILELARKYGTDGLLQAMDNLLDHGERVTRAEMTRLPQGTFYAEDIIEEDGHGNGPFTLRATITVERDRMVMDFTGTDSQAPGPVNCSRTGLVTAARCLFKALTDPDIPANGGCFRALEIVCPPGTLVSAEPPAAVSVYYEGLLGAMDVMWKALAPAMPDRLPAGHMRSVSATFIAGSHPENGSLFVMGEPLVGGWGASQAGDGDSCQFSALNGETYNIPIELFEKRYGLQVVRYSLNEEGGGHGRYRGGRGAVLNYRVTSDQVSLTYATTRTRSRPWALAGGEEGSNNYVEILRNDGSRERYGMCTVLPVQKGEIIRLVTANGGGYGDPTERDGEAVRLDVRNGLITPEQAQSRYGINMTAES